MAGLIILEQAVFSPMAPQINTPPQYDQQSIRGKLKIRESETAEDNSCKATQQASASRQTDENKSMRRRQRRVWQ